MLTIVSNTERADARLHDAHSACSKADNLFTNTEQTVSFAIHRGSGATERADRVHYIGLCYAESSRPQGGACKRVPHTGFCSAKGSTPSSGCAQESRTPRVLLS